MHYGHHHGHGQTGYYPPAGYPCQPGLVTLFGSMVGLGSAAMWSGARLVKHVMEDSLWGSCGCGHHQGHHDGCGHHRGSCCSTEYHHYVVDCSPHAHCGCTHHCA